MSYSLYCTSFKHFRHDNPNSGIGLCNPRGIWQISFVPHSENVQNFGLDTINIDSVFDKFKVRLLADNNEYTHD